VQIALVEGGLNSQCWAVLGLLLLLLLLRTSGSGSLKNIEIVLVF
jgi:hypothetical protein